MTRSHDQMAGNAAEIAASILTLVRELSSELNPRRSPTQPVHLDNSLERDLGLDSLARMELFNRIERAFHITLPDRVFADAETPRDLLRSVVSAGLVHESISHLEIARVDLDEGRAAPYEAQTLVEVLEWHVRTHPDRPHVRFYSDEGDGDALSYRQLMEGARSVATGLQEGGLQKGEPVVIMLPSGKEYFFSFFGALLSGGVPVPIYPPARKTQIEDHLNRQRAILSNCGAPVLITLPEAKPFARLLKAQVGSLRELTTVDELSSIAGAHMGPALNPQDIAFLQYTSGSTGDPKGVILSHANLLANIRGMGDLIQVGGAEVFVSWLPLYHDMGLIGAWLGSLYHAALLVLMSPLSFIARPQRWLQAIHRYRGTLSAAPNFAYELCVKRIEDSDLEGVDLASWRIAFNGAEPVSPGTVERFCERFGSQGFHRSALTPVYGLAECSVGLTFPPLERGPVIDRVQRGPFVRNGLAMPAGEEDSKALRFASCGTPLPDHEIRIVDSSGRELPERREGRLQFRGPSATSGYFRNAEQTGRLFHGDWLNSGDLAYVANGEIHITGRTKDIIIRAGRNIYPQELEEAVSDLPGVRKGNVVVFASADPDSGTERLVVLAETREMDSDRLEELRSSINTLAMDLVESPLDDVALAPPGTVLKTSSGKIRRSANRQMYERGEIGRKQRSVWLQVIRMAIGGLAPELRRAWRSAAAGCYAAYCWCLFCAFALLAWVSAAVIPGIAWRWFFLHRAARFIAILLGMKLTVHGLENLDRDEACVLVSNHASYIDSFALLAALPRRVSFVAKAELTQNRALRFFLRRLETEFVERVDRQKGIEDAKRVGRVLAEGRSLLFFAEGTFTRMPGLLPFHMGAFAAAAENSAPVVPIALRGTRSILRSESWFPRSGAISVTIGNAIEPIATGAEASADVWTTALRLREETREFILRSCGEPDLRSVWAGIS